MKFMHKITAVLAACAMLLPMTACGSNPQYYRYDYDLTEYITLAEYKGLPVTVSAEAVTDEEVEQEIMATVMYFAEEIEVDRASAKNDVVKFSCKVTLDGEEVPSLSEEDGSLTLGFEAYGANIEKALTGVKSGDTVEADRSFADNASDEKLAGKTVHYTFQITAVCETKAQEYSDVFVKAYMGFDTVAEFEAYVRASLEASRESSVLTAKVAQTWPVVVENTVVLQYPEKETAQIVNQLIAEVEAYTKAVGLKFDDYTQIRYGMTEEEFRANAEAMAQTRMKEDMIVYAIARAEDLKVTDEMYEAYAELYMEQMGFASVEELESVYTREAICEGILGDLAKECIANYAAAGTAE